MEKKIKPNLSIAQIINMSMGFLGIQMGFALQNGNASRILADLGADVHHLPLMWIVAPLMGLLVQPIIGFMGDNTWTKLGRRKPYFLIGAILAAIGLIFLPNSSLIASDGMKAVNFVGFSITIWIAIFFLAFMDASFNISMEPFRALVGDMLPKSQGALGFSVQTVLIGVGAVIGSSMPWILNNWFDINNTAPKGMIAPNVVYSFYIGAVILLGSIIYTIVTTKEYSPEDFRKFVGNPDAEKPKHKFKDIFVDFVNMPKRMKELGAVQFFSWVGLFLMWVFTTVSVSQSKYDVEIGKVQYQNLIQELKQKNEVTPELNDKIKELEKIKPSSKDNYFISSSLSSFLGQDVLYAEKELLTKIESYELPANLSKELAKIKKEKVLVISDELVQFLLSKETDPKLELVYKMKFINAQHGKSGDLVNILFTYYNFFAIPFAFSLPFLARKTSRKFVHFLALICGGLGLISIYFVGPNYLWISMLGVGFAWASILAMPYALLVDSLPVHKMGIYMGIFNFFIVIPQILNSLFSGWVVDKIFNNYAIYMLVIGGASLLLAALLTLRVKEPLFGEAKVLS